MAVASDRVDATLKGFTRWARTAPRKLSGDPAADAKELRLLLGMLRDHVGVDDPADLGTWARATFASCCWRCTRAR